MKLIKQSSLTILGVFGYLGELCCSRRPFELKSSEKKTPITFLLFHFQSVIFMLKIDVIMYGNVVVPNTDSKNEGIYMYVLFTLT